MMDVLKPPASLLCKIGSIIVHTEEMNSPDGHGFDRLALNQLLADPEVIGWLEGMGKLSMLPVKRNKPRGQKEQG